VKLDASSDLLAARRPSTGETTTLAASGSDPTVVASGLTKHFGSREVISELSFQAFTGRAFGLLGPNGSGKTTTVRL
jgi:ABC-2 type transport system ATP-binding protein